jgi:hypothetical protein
MRWIIAAAFAWITAVTSAQAPPPQIFDQDIRDAYIYLLGRTNWLPARKEADFSLFLRAYWPKTPVRDGSWTPPPAQRAN